MKKETEEIIVTLAVWGIIILGLLFVGFVFSIPKLIAFHWDWRCLFVECRIFK